MTYKFTCTATSLNPDKNGNAFTLESLKKFEDIERPILANYDADSVIGGITGAKVVDGKLVVEGRLFVDITDLYVAPSYKSISAFVDPETDTVVHTDIEVMSYGLVTAHADEEATPINFIKE